MSDEEEGFAGDLFGAEEASPPPPEPTFEIYERDPRFLDEQSGNIKQLNIRLVGSHPLWAHHLWNASKVFASFFDENKDIVRNRTVLELGAGGALPSLIAAANGAAKVVITDYPDAELIDNIRYNVATNNLMDDERVNVQGYIWGTSTDKLEQQLPEGQSTFDVIILSDLVFNHSQHHAMLSTCRKLLTPNTGRAYVFYTHHRPHLAHKDLEFFNIARRPYSKDIDPDDREAMGYGFEVDHFIQKKMHVMFEEDPGDVETRATVHGWQLWIL